MSLQDAALVVLAVLGADMVELGELDEAGLDVPDLFGIFVDRFICGDGAHAGDVVESVFSPEVGLSVEVFEFFLSLVIAAQVAEDEIAVGHVGIRRFEEDVEKRAEGLVLLFIDGKRVVFEGINGAANSEILVVNLPGIVRAIGAHCGVVACTFAE